MPRQKKKYSIPVSAAPITAYAAPEPPSYSCDLKGASKYTGYSIWALRKAITSKLIPVASSKPYIIRRADLESFVDSRVQMAA